ncbi:MAG: hypothetical protein QM503_02020 [Bacteroidota bacterium]
MKYLTIIVALFFITSCCNHEPKQEEKEALVHESEGNAVTTDNGEKWKANFATTKGIRNMTGLVNEVKKDYKLSNYRELGANLQKEFQHIFQRCDMTGEAHNQLHNYLHPMTGWFKELKEGDLNECKTATKELEDHLKKYDTYFK